MIGAIAAVIGGTVVLGSNTSTLNQTASAMEAAKARRAELASVLPGRLVSGYVE
jgi:pseudouridine-5'-phosphate glycosidase